ncbi:MAG TPA: heparinase II/III family protein [Abditibacteriaceae bacterium]|jgi:hypothetical protein
MSSYSRRDLLRHSFLLGAFWPAMTQAQNQSSNYARMALPAGKSPNRPYTPSPDDAGWLLEDVWPPLYFGNEITAEARRKIDSQEWARQLFNWLREEADIALKLPPQLPQERAGWRHDFYSRTTGGPLLFELEQGEKFLDPITKQREGNAEQHRAWVLLTHERTLRMMRSVGLLYQLTNEEKYLRWVELGLLALAEHFAKIGPQKAEEIAKGANGGAVYFQPLYDAGILLVMANATSFVKDKLKDETRAKVQGVFEERVPFLMKFLDGKAAHNMGCFASAAIGLSGELWNRGDWIHRALHGKNGFADQLRSGVPMQGEQIDGLWGEGTLFYHFYSLTTLIALRELAARRETKIEADVLRRFEAMFEAPLQLADAQNRLPALSDFGAPRHFSLSLYRHLYEYAAGKINLPKYGPALARIYEASNARRTDLAALAYGPMRLPAALQLAPRATRLPVANIGVFRESQPDMWLLFRGGKYVGGHDHPDRLSIFLHAEGVQISPDLGEPGYALRKQTGDYFRTTLAHNTLFANEQDQKGAAYLDWQPEKKRARGGIKAGGISFRRTVFFAPPFVVLLDEYESDKEQRFNWIYHAYGTLQMEEMIAPPAEPKADEAVRKIGEPEGPPPKTPVDAPPVELTAPDLKLPPLPDKEEWSQFTKRKTILVGRSLRAVWQVQPNLQLRLHSTSSAPFEATSGRTIGQPFPDDQGALLLRSPGTSWRVATVLEVVTDTPQVTGIELLANGAALDLTGVRREWTW